MGCAQSKVDNEDSVARCKERRNLMKEAVAVRNAFAAAHSGYAVALKETGAALSDYAQGEVPSLPENAAAPLDVLQPPSDHPPPPPPPYEESSLPLPPPPLPAFSPVEPLKRAATMPAALGDIKRKMKADGGMYDDDDDDDEEEEEEKGGLRRRKKGIERSRMGTTPTKASLSPSTPPEVREMAWDYFFMDPHRSLDEVQEEDEEEDYIEEKAPRQNAGVEEEFMTPEKRVDYEANRGFDTPEASSATQKKQFLHSKTAPSSGGGNAARKCSGRELLRILSEIDDHFLRSSESAQEVSKMLEATRLHYHSNFADNQGHIDHAQRVMQVITWNKSFRGAPNGDASSRDDDKVDSEDYETHATVLDKLLAWEKKLYEEVKAGELIKLEYQRKVAALNRLKKRNASSEQLEKAKAAVSHLHTRYIVDMQSLDSTVSEMTDIRDKQLYRNLVRLVQEMAKMWRSMCQHNDDQLKAVSGLKSLDVSGSVDSGSGAAIETSREHHERTKQLCIAVEQWNSQFEKMVTNQRQYVNSLNGWLKLNLIPIESTLREKASAAAASSPPRNPTPPPIQPLLLSWHDHLEKLPDDVAKSSIFSFKEVIKSIALHQEEEMKLREKRDGTRREYLRKKQGFEEWYQRHVQRRTPPPRGADDGAETASKDPAVERRIAVEMLKKRLDEETDEHRKHCVHVREKSLASLKIRLPELFRALSDYSHACFDAYESLRMVIQSQNLLNHQEEPS